MRMIVKYKDREAVVNSYFTYDQIQHIANEVIKLSTWAEREQMIDFMTLCYATNIDRQEIKSTSHDELLQSGIIDAVRTYVNNYDLIKEAVAYEESINKQLTKIITQLPQVAKEAIEKDKEGK